MQQLKIKEGNLYYGFPPKIEMITLKGKHVIKDGKHCLVKCEKDIFKNNPNNT